jgi:hypothetical protein
MPQLDPAKFNPMRNGPTRVPGSELGPATRQEAFQLQAGAAPGIRVSTPLADTAPIRGMLVSSASNQMKAACVPVRCRVSNQNPASEGRDEVTACVGLSGPTDVAAEAQSEMTKLGVVLAGGALVGYLAWRFLLKPT